MNSDSCRRFRFLIPVFILAFIALLTCVVHALWNGVLTDVVAVKAITYWQALGLLVLSKILFGGFPGKRGGGWGPRGRDRMVMAKHWESLTPEQRDKMREEIRQRFGDWPRPWCGPKRGEPDGPGKSTTG